MHRPAENSRQTDVNTSGVMEHFAGAIALFETIIATTIVVGMFSAISQPFGWPAVGQILLCTGLGVMLWMADSHLEFGQSFAAESAGHAAGRQPVREKT